MSRKSRTIRKYSRMTFSNGPLSPNYHCINSIVMIAIAMTTIEFSQSSNCASLNYTNFMPNIEFTSVFSHQYERDSVFVINAESAFHYFICCSCYWFVVDEGLVFGYNQTAYMCIGMPYGT